jgi:hypothetical protein
MSSLNFFFNKNHHILDRILIFFIFLIIPGLISGPFITDLFVVITAIYCFFLFFYLKKIILLNRIFFFFLIFWLYLVLTSLFSNEIIVSLKSTFPYIRFILFSFVIFFFYNKYNIEFIKIIYYSLLFSFIFVAFDNFYQFFNGYDLFGFPKLKSRLTGPFGSELITGSYLARTFPILTFLYYKIYKKINLNFFLISSLGLLAVFISGERVSFALYLIVFFPVFLFLTRSIYVYTFFLINLFLVIFFTFYSSDLKERMIDNVLCQTGLNSYLKDSHKVEKCDEIDNKLDQKKMNFISPTHQFHSLAALEVFKNNIVIGAGVKLFRYECKKTKYPQGCQTHPHNMVMQILAETGIIGLIFLCTILFHIYRNFFYFFIFYNKKKIIYKVNEVFIINLCFFQSFFFFLPTGQIFNNWLSILFYFPLGFYIKYLNDNNIRSIFGIKRN